MQAIFEQSEAVKKKKGMGSRNHSSIQARIAKFIDRKYLDEFEVIPELSIVINGSEKIPDLSIYKTFEFKPDEDEIKVEELPLGVIEILSPKQHLNDLTSKAKEYLSAGISSYWLVLPALRSIYVYEPSGIFKVFIFSEILKDTQLGIELDLNKVFS